MPCAVIPALGLPLSRYGLGALPGRACPVALGVSGPLVVMPALIRYRALPLHLVQAFLPLLAVALEGLALLGFAFAFAFAFLRVVVLTLAVLTFSLLAFATAVTSASSRW